MKRLDLLFSFWILIWYVLYIINLIKYNPKFWLFIALLSTLYNFYVMFYFKRYYMAVVFIIIVIIFKVIPIWTLRNTALRVKDIVAGLVLFIIYYIWLTYNNDTLYSLFHGFYISIRDNKPTSIEFMYFLNSLKILSIKQ
jgi:hypothetical protein